MDTKAKALILLVYVCLKIYQGVLQENLLTKQFGPNGERFQYPAVMNVGQDVIYITWSVAVVATRVPMNFLFGGNGVAPCWAYWSAGLSYTIGRAMGIEALKHISFSARVLAKSSRIIQAMLMGSLVYGRRYTFQKYLCAFLVVVGLSNFALLKTSSVTISKLADPNNSIGYGLCFLNLILDGFTKATLLSIRERFPNTGGSDIVLGMHLWGTIYNLIYMFVWPHGSGYEAVRFWQQHPEIINDIFYYWSISAVSKLFFILTIAAFSILITPAITTTRKFLSILVSSLWNGNPLSKEQFGCVLMVVSGLLYETYFKWRRRAQRLPN